MLGVPRVPVSVSFAPGTKNFDGNKPLEKQARKLIKAGKSFHDAKNMPQAIDAYSQAIGELAAIPNQDVRDALTARALVLRGNVFRHLGNIDSAIKDTSDAREIDPSSLKYVRVY